MAQGAQVFDGSGNVVVDTSDRLGRILGIVNMGTSDGSVTNALLSQGTLFYTMLPLDTNVNGIQPTLTQSGTTLSWSFGGSSWGLSSQLIYGVY